MSQKQPQQIENRPCSEAERGDELKAYDGPWPLNGYAPGGYQGGQCQTCKKRLDEVDKRAFRCFKCALSIHESNGQKAAKYAPDMAAFQRRIRDARKARNMSLDEVAAAAGFTKSHIWELENGSASNPTIRAVWGLSKALCVSPAWLLGLNPDAPPVDPLALEVAALIQRRIAQ